MSELIQKMNAITKVNLSDPMIVNMDDWNGVIGEVRQVLEQLEQAQARVAELEDLAAEAALLFEDIRQGEYIVDSFTAQPYNAVQINMSSKPWLLRKQAEAVEDFVQYMDSDGPWSYREDAMEYAQSLRLQADEIEND